MKKTMAAMALFGCLAGGPAGAQVPGSGTAGAPRMPATSYPSPTQGVGAGAGRTPAAPSPYTGTGTTGAAAAGNGPGAAAPGAVPASSGAPGAAGRREYDINSALPGPTPDDQLKPVSIALPDDPLEPYLLTKQNGPFMVLAKVFRGPDSERMALALCKELRQDYKLPAYILRSKEWPMKSNIRGVPVQAPSMTTRAAIKQPEQIRIHDEAAVLVGDEKTLQASELLLHKVKKIKPKCLDGMPKLWAWREGLSHAIRTTNPYVPAQWLYPRAPDRLVVSMNRGLRSIAHCPGTYTLQVAQFTGRSAFDLNGNGNSLATSIIDPKSSPLRTAHDDAERLADNLSRSSEFRKLGVPVYVHHDRTSSRVFVGSFSAPDDPRLSFVHGEMMKISGQQFVQARRGTWRRSDPMVVPASGPTQVAELKKDLQ
ncbi:MAG: hypothetical protein ACYC61_23095 [Isosphaeraceae bacterium]